MLCCVSLLAGCGGSAAGEAALQPLPAPEVEEGLRGEQFGIDKNINESTIDQYLGREDTVYRDMRMLKDEAEYEAIGGDAWLSGIVEGFEVVPLPYLVNVEGLPEEVGSTYSGETLFTHTEEGYLPNYEESMDILTYLFPKDKNIILMCGGGGYAGMTKAMLTELGWDANKIYNAGGYWFYQGEHNLPIRREENGKTYYDFHKLNYHGIVFSALHRLDSAPAVESADPVSSECTDAALTVGLKNLDADTFAEAIKNKETFGVVVYLPGCSSCKSFAPVAIEVAESGQMPIYGLNYQKLKEADAELAELVNYTPAFLLYQEGELIARLDAGRNEDISGFKDAKGLSEWIGSYMEFKTVEGTAESEVEDCGDACTAFGNLQ